MVVVLTMLWGGRVGEDDDDVNEEKLKMVEIQPSGNKVWWRNGEGRRMKKKGREDGF